MNSTKRYTVSFFLVFLVLNCSSNSNAEQHQERSYKMGFTTWSYGPNVEDVNNTYNFIENHADIYAEHIDNKIPWNAWINNTPLPQEFIAEIEGRIARKIATHKLLLSVSLLNLNRDDLAEDFNNSTPIYTNLDDSHIEDAYFNHVNYLVNAFSPDYLVVAIEVNELRLRAPDKWPAYKQLISNVATRLKQNYPNLQISQSISLHNFYQTGIPNEVEYENEIINHINTMDFAAFSFYPFFKNLNTVNQFQEWFNFLNTTIQVPIAFVETSHLAEHLNVPNLNISINGNESEQDLYLETLLSNAQNENYKFIVWWTHRDFDALWETFPPELSDLGQLWRDTGLLDENGLQRQAFETWMTNFNN